MHIAALLLTALVLAACQPTAPSITPLSPAGSEVIPPTTTPADLPISAPVRSPFEQTPSPTPTQTPTNPPYEVCSPLEDVDLDELEDILSNPFQSPRPGLDDGHHGVDYAFYSRGSRSTMLGLPVHALLPGQVASVILDRPPYGNALIVETRMDALPTGLIAALTASPQPTPVSGDIRLTCPTSEAPLSLGTDSNSIYVLYAHLNQPPLVAVGDAVKCGQTVGEVGTSGRSVNPHLHLETRWGPSGAVFPSMAHYEIQASDEERSNYCLWRVSGTFQMLDPMVAITSFSASAFTPIP